MATVVIPEEVMAVVDAEVREHSYRDATEYLIRLVRQDQKRHAKEQLEAYVLEGVDSGEEIDMTAQSWRDLRNELHRQAGIN